MTARSLGPRSLLMNEASLSVEDRQALASWGLGTVLSATVPATGSVNRTVLLQTSAGAFVLRVSRRERERGEWEHTAIAWASDYQIPVCRPILLPDGGTIVERDGSLYALFPFAKGQQARRAEIIPQQARMAGECLGHIHTAFSSFVLAEVRRKNLSVDIKGVLAQSWPCRVVLIPSRRHWSSSRGGGSGCISRHTWPKVWTSG